MTTCPKCHNSITPTDITCPHCQTTLKAFGHPGIAIHRAEAGQWLCNTCAYHKDETCNFPQYPYAQDCTLYTPADKPVAPPVPRNMNLEMQRWIRRNSTWLILLGLFIVCLVLAMRR
jgi:hypothetical protein